MWQTVKLTLFTLSKINQSKSGVMKNLVKKIHKVSFNFQKKIKVQLKQWIFEQAISKKLGHWQTYKIMKHHDKFP